MLNVAFKHLYIDDINLWPGLTEVEEVRTLLKVVSAHSPLDTHSKDQKEP